MQLTKKKTKRKHELNHFLLNNSGHANISLFKFYFCKKMFQYTNQFTRHYLTWLFKSYTHYVCIMIPFTHLYNISLSYIILCMNTVAEGDISWLTFFLYFDHIIISVCVWFLATSWTILDILMIIIGMYFIRIDKHKYDNAWIFLYTCNCILTVISIK